MKDLSVLVAQLAVVLLPGIVWAKLDERFASRAPASDLGFTLRVLVFGIVAYVVTYLGYVAAHRAFSVFDLAQADRKNVINGDVTTEIAIATAVGSLLAVLWLYLVNYKILTRFLQVIGATRRFGDEDVWDFSFNSFPANEDTWVNIRDFDKKIVYSGSVKVFSESDKLRELVLNNVVLYDFEGVELFRVPSLYLARKSDDLHIEFP